MSSSKILTLIILLAAIVVTVAPVCAQDSSPQSFIISPYATIDVSQLPAPGRPTMQMKVRGRPFPRRCAAGCGEAGAREGEWQAQAFGITVASTDCDTD